MEVRILGDLEVREGVDRIAVDSSRERALLEALALEPGRIVGHDSLVDALWGHDPPPSATKTLQSHVSRLRALLPPDTIGTTDAGYRLQVDTDDVDALRMEELVTEASVCARAGEWAAVLDLLDAAVDMWRGDPVPDLADGPLRAAARARLTATLQRALAARAEADLALGEHERLVPELREATERFPYDEQLWASLMLALARSGRRAEALAAYGRLRRRLRDDLGVAPSAPTRDLEDAILREDPTTSAPPALPPLDRLPTPVTSLVDRQRELDEVADLVRRHRLVVLVGPGGVGKTRLAVEVARRIRDQDPERFADGAVLVELSGAEDAGDVATLIASSLRRTAGPGSVGAIAETAALAGSSSMLVVLDAAEHVADHVATLAGDLLTTAPGLTVLVTSRTTLATPEAVRYRVEPLDWSVDTAGGGEPPARRLFLERIPEGRPSPTALDVAAVDELCRRADGLPLGIELLAVRVGTIDVNDLLEDLRHHPHHVLDPPRERRGESRHGSLADVLDASMRLLDDRSLVLLARLSVFRGSFDLEAVRAMTGSGDVRHLLRLVDASLVERAARSGPERRYRLADTTRLHAGRLLDEPAVATARRDHAAHYARLCRRAATAFPTQRGWTWARRLDRELPDLRAALRWHLDHDPVGALAFAPAMAQSSALASDYGVTLTLANRLVEIADRTPGPSSRERAWALLAAGWPRFVSGDTQGAMQAHEAAADSFRRLGDDLGAAYALTGRAHMELLATGDHGRAMPMYEEALATTARVANPEARALAEIETAQALAFGDHVDERLRSMLDDAEATFRRTRDHQRLAHLALVRCVAAYVDGDLDGFRSAAQAMVDEGARSRTRSFGQAGHVALAVHALHCDEPARAERLLRAALRMAVDDRNRLQAGWALQVLACQRSVTHRPREAARLWGAARAVTPEWELFRGTFNALLEPARRALGDDFEPEASAGAEIDVLVLGAEVVADAAQPAQPAHNRAATR